MSPEALAATAQNASPAILSRKINFLPQSNGLKESPCLFLSLQVLFSCELLIFLRPRVLRIVFIISAQRRWQRSLWTGETTACPREYVDGLSSSSYVRRVSVFSGKSFLESRLPLWQPELVYNPTWLNALCVALAPPSGSVCWAPTFRLALSGVMAAIKTDTPESLRLNV